MGHIKHHAIIVTCFSDTHARIIKNIANKIFKGQKASPIITSKYNGYYSFFIAPDGSKEGWMESNVGDAKRKEIIDSLKSLNKNGIYSDYAEISYGGDAGKPKVLNYSK